ncbi:hypothetical protein niasHT_027351 [Heterodera trifolii]|uniref:polynucleotide adenylyltransferase n=1 Tax=Heterodera trifolii TaxID=157864 RepID=A0ABD2JTV7_9BILA
MSGNLDEQKEEGMEEKVEKEDKKDETMEKVEEKVETVKKEEKNEEILEIEEKRDETIKKKETVEKKKDETVEKEVKQEENREKEEKKDETVEKVEEKDETVEKEERKEENREKEERKEENREKEERKEENREKEERKEENREKEERKDETKLIRNQRKFLALKYGEFVQILSRNGGEKPRPRMVGFPALEHFEEEKNWEKSDESAHSVAHLLDIGILANEIWHYVQTMKALNGKSKKAAKIEKEWAQLKQRKLEEEINSRNLEQTLFHLLKRIETEGIAAKNAQNLNLENNGEIGKINNYLTMNGYLSEEELRKKRQIMDELTTIVKGWCPNATIQFAKLILGNEKLEAICILSDQFDRQLIFGRLNCEIQKCTDSSLYCIICTHSAVVALRKRNNYKQKSALQKLEFLFLDVPIEMAFIFASKDKLPISADNERINLNNYGIFANYFVENIKKLINSDNFDEKMNQGEMKIQEDLLENPSCFRNKFEMDKILKEKRQLEITKEKAQERRKIRDEQEAMLRAVSRNLMNERILEILSSVRKLDKNYNKKVFNENSNERLRIILAYLELWAKNNFIYGTEIGYLNSSMLLIMVAKVFMMFPEASVPFLIEKFFLIYSKWKWPIPVQLAQIEQHGTAELLVWTPGREWLLKKQFLPGKISQELAMPIILPMFPEQNEALRINLPAAKVIQNELKSAFVQIMKMNEAQQIIGPILDNKKFIERYEHFLTFICTGNESIVETFCHFIGKRLGHELLHFVEKSSDNNLINYFHILPKLMHIKQSSEDEKMQKQKRMWLVGLKVPKQKSEKDEALADEIKAIFNGKLAEIGAKIQKDFEGRRYYNVQLKAEYVGSSEVDTNYC